MNEVNPAYACSIENNAYVDVFYTISFNNDHHLTFGVKAGATFQDVGLLDLQLHYFNDDVAFSENVSETCFNVGVSLFCF